LIFSFFGGGVGVIMRILSGLAGIVFMIALKIKLGNDFANDMGNQLGNEAAGMIQLNYQAGYWLTLIAFASAAVISAVKKEFKIKITNTSDLPKQSSEPPGERPPPT